MIAVPRAALQGPVPGCHRQCWRTYAWLQAQNVVSTDMFISYVNTLLATQPRVAARLCAYRHALVDEVQDNDRSQYNFVRHLAHGGCSVFFVGDPNQCIYEFRGADVRPPLSRSRRVRLLPGCGGLAARGGSVTVAVSAGAPLPPDLPRALPAHREPRAAAELPLRGERRARVACGATLHQARRAHIAGAHAAGGHSAPVCGQPQS